MTFMDMVSGAKTPLPEVVHPAPAERVKEPLSETTAQVISIGSGVVVGGIAAYGTHCVTEREIKNPTLKLIASALVGAGVGGWMSAYNYP